MRQLASTADKGSPDSGRIITRLTQAGEWMGVGVAVIVVSALAISAMGLSIPFSPWPIVMIALWTGHTMLRRTARSLAARRWDVRLAITLRTLAVEGAQLPPDLIRLRSMLDRGPIAVDIWKGLPHSDTLSMIRLSAQLVNTCSIQPSPTIELGGEVSEATSRVLDFLDEARPAPYAPILRLK